MPTDPTTIYPLPKFHFQVNWGKGRMGFTEICGLEFETEVIDYREGNSPEYNDIKQPGRTKYANVTLKHGVFLGDLDMYNWWQSTYYFMAQAVQFRRTVTIDLLSEAHVPIITMIRQVLDQRWNHRASAERFRDELEDYMSPDYAEDTLRAAIAWGRYAELFSYDEEAGQFSLEEAE